MEFHFNSWLTYFYFYCIVGWIFESVNVSIRTKHWTNRGFMKGPWLPLYGSGAVLILIVTQPVETIAWAVYLVGALAATVLEYFTGEAMLRIFKVRYWDYRYRKIQYKGHICLVSTVVWGFLSLLMVYVIHPFVERLVNSWNQEVVSIGAFFITIGMVYDFATAFREAMDLRALIIQAEELKQQLEAAAEQRRKRLEESMEQKKEQLEEVTQQRRERLEEDILIAREQWNHTMEENKEFYREQIEEAATVYRERRMETESEQQERRERTLAELEAAKENLMKRMEQHSERMLMRNPRAVFGNMDEESQEIRRRIAEKRRK